MKAPIPFLIVSALLFALPAFVQAPEPYISGNALLSDCNEHSDVVNKMSCLQYIAGIADTLQFLSPSLPDHQIRFCPPENVTHGQEHLIVVKWLHARPEVLHLPAASLAVPSRKPSPVQKDPEL